MRGFTVDDLRPHLGANYRIVGDPSGLRFVDARPILQATEQSLVFVNPGRQDKDELLERTNARIVICDDSLEAASAGLPDRCLVVVPNPRLVYARVLDALFATRPDFVVHPSAVVSAEAVLDEQVHVGPGTYVGRCELGEGTVVHGGCYLYDGVRIGRNVTVHAGCVLGGDGFGFERDEDGSVQKFPHLGGVVIEDEAEIQAMTAIDRGVLGNTVIRRQSKIGSQCHLAHNVEIGEATLVAPRVKLGGSVRVGRCCWLGPGSVYRDTLTIGDGAFVGIGALVVKDVEPGAAVMGNPARPVEEYKAMLAATRRLVGAP